MITPQASPDGLVQPVPELSGQSHSEVLHPDAPQVVSVDVASAQAPTGLEHPSHSQLEPLSHVENVTPAANVEHPEGVATAVTEGSPVQEILTPVTQEMTWVPVVGGRKMQEILRDLREQWKQTDQGGLPNHALWKKFDQACNRAYKVVEVWQEKVKKEGAEHKAQRLALIEEVKAFAQTKAQGPDWKGVARQLHQYSERWRESGHVSERVFAELQPMWKEAMRLAHEPIEKVQAASIQKRQAMIEEAKALGQESQLRIDAVKNLQQRWQQESQSVLLDRKQEQKLWDLFREPIDAAFNRKTQQRQQNMAALSAHDEAVVQASKLLEEAVRQEDAKLIKERMQALDAALRGQSAAQSQALKDAPSQAQPEMGSPAQAPEQMAPQGQSQPEVPPSTASETLAAESSPEAAQSVSEESEDGQVQSEKSSPTPAPKAPPKPVVAVRGDDRPGQKPGLSAPPAPGKDSRSAKGGFARGAKDNAPGRGRREFEGQARPSRFDDAPRGPRLSDAAFRMQRHALESAEQTLRKLSAMAHGESLMQLMQAWEHRDAERVPALKDLSSKLSPAERQLMVQSLQVTPKAQSQASTSILRLEMASEVPTPAQFLSDRRALQLQLLTRRNDPSPRQTWTRDVAQVLETSYDAGLAQRLQNTLKVLLKK
jgi:predicted secreted protein